MEPLPEVKDMREAKRESAKRLLLVIRLKQGGKMPSGAEQDPPAYHAGGDVRRLREVWVEAFNQQDADRVTSFYAEDAVELPMNGAPAVHGKAKLRELVNSMFAEGIGELKFQHTQVGYTEPLAFEMATYSVRPCSRNPGLSERNGNLVATWRRQEDGEFRITISVWSKQPA